MNRIKQFFLVNAGLTDEHAASPFLWKSKTIPRPAKKGNLYHLEFILISVIAALAIALVSVMLLLANDQQKSFWIPVVFFVHHFLLQLSAYDVFLEDKPKKPGRSAGRPSATKENSAPGSEEAAPSHPAASPTSLPPPSPRQVIIHHQETLYRNFFEVQKATLQYEKFDGTLTDHVQRFNCARRHSAAILLHDPVKDDLVLVEQFRYPAYVYDAKKSWLIEIIAGIIENNESPAEVARREAMEETGYEVHGLKFLCEFFPSPGGSSERVFIFFGMVGRQVAEGGGLSDEAENIRVVRLPAREAYRLADEGAIHDAKTLVALLSVRERLSKSISRHGA
jgi:ADP-ribose pyrophosphatase